MSYANNSKFTKQMEDKFMKELENVNMDSDSNDEDQYYQGERLRLQKQLELIKLSRVQKTQKTNIMKQLEKNLAHEGKLMQEFINQAKQLPELNDRTSLILSKETNTLIKNKLLQYNQPKYTLTDEKVQQTHYKKQKQKKIQIQESLYRNKQPIIDVMQQRLLKAAVQRQNTLMARQDQYSIKSQLYYLSQFFKERFITPDLKPYKQKNCRLGLSITQPKSTFTNLCPMPNQQYNVMPKNTPQLALRNIKKTKKLKLIPKQKENVNIKIQSNNPQAIIFNNQELKVNFNPQKFLHQQNQNIDTVLKKYINGIQHIFIQINNFCQTYNPKFIKTFLDEDEKGSNIVIDQQTETNKIIKKSIKHIIQFQQSQSLQKQKQLRLTFQNINSIEGIQNYTNIQSLSLQYNEIKSIQSLNSSSKLIQITLSHNMITYVNLKLQWLKFINLEHNKLKTVQFSCKNLEFVYLGNNCIEDVRGLDKSIRILKLQNNKLNTIYTCFQKCYFLEELTLTKNRIKILEGLQTCIMLRKLDISSNMLTNITKQCIFLFLNELNLSKNNLITLPKIFLPSLQKLYIENNKLHQYPTQLIYLPKIKILNLDENNLQGFSFVWAMLRYSKFLQILKYDNNQCFLILRQKVKELYEYIIYRNMEHLKILNQNPTNIGLKKYYQSAYEHYLCKSTMFNKKTLLLQDIENKLDFILKQNQIISSIQRNSYKNKSKFTQQPDFIRYKSIELAKNLLQIGQFVINDRSTVLRIKQSIFYKHDRYQQKIKQSFHKITSMLIRWKYKKNKRISFYKKNINKVIKNCENILRIIQLFKLRSGYKSIHAFTMKYTYQQAAIIIQKNWRRYRTRKRYLRIIQKLKRSQIQQQFEEVDMNWFDQFEDNHQFAFDIPDHLNFEDYIIKPQVFKHLNAKRQIQHEKYDMQEKKQQLQKQKPIMNNFMGNISDVEKKRKKQQQQQAKRFMDQFGFEGKATMEAFKLKNKKKQDRLKKQREKNMTAAQRYQRFKNNK